jgi:uncharacterized membrane-anchored protein
MTSPSRSLRTLIAGGVCTLILSGMMVLHAWPLWTGETILLAVVPIDPRDMFRGEYVRLDTPATRLTLQGGSVPPPGLSVMPAGESWKDLPDDPEERGEELYRRHVYVQLEPRGDFGEFLPVTISLEPLDDRANLRGRVTSFDAATGWLEVDYGLDRYFMQEGTAGPVEDALRNRQRVQMEVAVTDAGRSRIRRLLVNGVPVVQ